MKKRQRGFTLLEILLVVGIIAILAGIVILAINPNRQLGAARNAQRKSDLKQINSAVTQYYIDNGSFIPSIIDTLTEICDTGNISGDIEANPFQNEVDCTDLIDLSPLISTYFTAVPKDPKATTTNGTGYFLQKDSHSKIILTAPEAENDMIIAVGTSTNNVVPENYIDWAGSGTGQGFIWSAVLPVGFVNWSTAVAACAALTPAGRLPTINELAVALDDSFNGGSSPGNFGSGAYWSGTPFDYQNSYFGTNMFGFVSTNFEWNYILFLVRCVR